MTPESAGSPGKPVWRAAVTFGVVASAVALAGLVLGTGIAAFPLVGGFFQAVLAATGLWLGSRIVFHRSIVSASRWPGGFATLFLGPASLDLIWSRWFFFEPPAMWILLLSTIIVIGFFSVLGLRVIVGRTILLPAGLLAAFSSGSYALGVAERSERFALLWILFVIWLGGWWLSAAHAQVLDSDRSRPFRQE